MTLPAVVPRPPFQLDDLSIVIPVFNAVEETLECLAALLTSDAADCAIWLMDDASEWSVQQRLSDAIASYPNVTLVSHFRNRGYTGNVAMGLGLTSTAFVCLLNSDTLVPARWATPMVAQLRDNPQLAGIGPLSNAASYQSVPQVIDPATGLFSDNDQLGFAPDQRTQVAMLVAHLGQGICVDVPILNGFCTVFRRAALDRVGGFDVASFPQGYGEENDLCIRLKAAGFRLSVHSGVFVHHQKSKSFGPARKATLSAKGAQTLSGKYGPDLVPSLGAQLKASAPLGILRDLLGIALSASAAGIGPRRRINGTSAPVLLGSGSRFCITLAGNSSYRIDPDRIMPIRSSTEDILSLSTTHCGVSVTIPDGASLTLFGTAPVATALMALSLLSVEQLVYIPHWHPQDSVDENAPLGWPASWCLPNDMEQLNFSHTCLAG